MKLWQIDEIQNQKMLKIELLNVISQLSNI